MRAGPPIFKVIVGCILFASCSSGGDTSEDSTGLSGSITISAAASLTDSFTLLAQEFERIHPDVKTQMNFGSSSGLAKQIQTGAPSDIIAAADLTILDQLVSSGDIAKGEYPIVFAQNVMSLVVKKENPFEVKTLTDLSRVEFISLCAESVPCGIYAKKVLQSVKVDLPESRIARAMDAKMALNLVVFGDADAAIVYLTDAISARGKITTIEIPPTQNVHASYAIAPISKSSNYDLAIAFIEFLLSEKGQTILKSFGFSEP